jgi:2,3-dihydroxy-p-cumate/2,3-dihydroxybenzoate 3,4-dioxygenase
MADIEGLGYVVVGVPDVGRATAFWSEVCRLHVVRQDASGALLTGDRRHHWLQLEQRPTSELIRLGFKATSPAGIEAVADRLTAAGTEVARGTDTEGVSNAIRFRDVNGFGIEVYEAMAEQARPAIDAYEGLDILLHAVVQAPDPLGSAWFYEDVLGLRRSDRIADLVLFLRAGNGYHHSLGVAKGGVAKLDHIAILVHDLDDVMRLRSHAMATGTLSDDVVRHTASGSISVYVRDEVNDLGVEFCTQHMVIDDEKYRGRVLVPSASTVNLWSDPFPTTSWQRDDTLIQGGQGGGTDAAKMAIGPEPLVSTPDELFFAGRNPS